MSMTEPRGTDSAAIAASSASASSLSSVSLRFLLLGDVGVGKSAFVDTFIATLANVQSTELSHETIAVPSDSSSSTSSVSFQLEVTHVQTGSILDRNPTNSASTSRFDDPLGLIPPKITTPAREISFITVPGYSSTLNPSQTLSTTDDYLNHHLRTVTSVFSPTISSAQLAWFLITGSKAHTLPTCAFYFVLYELKPIDILYMKLIHERVNLVPVISKADTVSKNELWVLKRRMIRQLKLNGIQFHTFGLDVDTVEAMTEQRQWGAPPFVVSTKVDPHSQELFESELEEFVQLCVFDRVRFMQEDAARKVISWRRAFGPSTDTAATVEQIWHQNALNRSNTNTGGHGANTAPPAHQDRPMDLAPFTPPPPSSLPASTEATSAPDAPSTMTSQFLPPPSFTAGGVVVQPYTSVAPSPSLASPSPVIAASSTFQNPATPEPGVVSPPPSMSQVSMSPQSSSATAYTPSTTYSPTPRNATEARVMVIHHSTGMVVDPSNRPSEIMDADTVNTVHARLTTEGDHFAGDSVFKVEIPNSGMSYQPGTVDSSGVNGAEVYDATQQHQQQQQQQPYLYQGETYLVPPGDLYQAAFMAGTGEYPVINASTSNLGNMGGMVVSMDGQHIPDIWEAAELGDLAIVQYHLNNGVSPDQRNSSKSTLLHRTAWQGTHPYAVMRLLISYGANVNLANENGNTVLQNVLMKHDDPQLIKLLLDNGAEAMILNKEGMNTLEVAALFNKLESARYLLENDLSSSEPQSIVNALQRAKSPDKKAVKNLLKSWQGKDGERKRFDLMQRLQAPEAAQHKQLKQQHQASTSASNDGASIHSFETTKGGNPNSSKASSVHHDDFGGSTTNVSTVSSQHSNGHQTSNSTLTSTQQKHMSSRFNLKAMRTAAPSMSNLFGRKN